jgi:hypothetical protein
MFEKMDLNKDNMINFDELKLGLHKLGHQMADADVQILMDAVSYPKPPFFLSPQTPLQILGKKMGNYLYILLN